MPPHLVPAGDLCSSINQPQPTLKQIFGLFGHPWQTALQAHCRDAGYSPLQPASVHGLSKTLLVMVWKSLLPKTGRQERLLEPLARRVDLLVRILGFIFAYGARRGSEDPTELLWQHPHSRSHRACSSCTWRKENTMVSQCGALNSVAQRKFLAVEGFFSLVGGPAGKRVHPQQMKCVVQLGAACTVHGEHSTPGLAGRCPLRC